MRSRRRVASLTRSNVGEIMFSRISWTRKERWGDAVHRCRSLEPGTVLAVLDLESVATGRSSQLGGSRTPSAASTAAALFSLQLPLAAVLSGASPISSALHHRRPGIMIIIVLVRIATVIVVVMVVASSSPSSSFLYALSSLSSSSPPSSSSSSRRHRLHHYDLGIKKVPCCPLCLPPAKISLLALLTAPNAMAIGAACRRNASQTAPCPAAPRVHHGRISSRRYQLLRNKYLRVRRELKDVRREVKRETIKLKRALMPREKVGHHSASSAPCRENKYEETAGGEYQLCECCFQRCGDETCKGCHRPLCSNCCFASEEAPKWYCRACVVRVKLLPLWRPATERTMLPLLRPAMVSFEE